MTLSAVADHLGGGLRIRGERTKGHTGFELRRSGDADARRERFAGSNPAINVAELAGGAAGRSCVSVRDAERLVAGTTEVTPGDRAERFDETVVWPVAGRA